MIFQGYNGEISFRDLVKTFTDLYTKANRKLTGSYSIADLKEYSSYERNINLSERIVERINGIYGSFSSAISEKIQAYEDSDLDVSFSSNRILNFFEVDDFNLLLKLHERSRYSHQRCLDKWFMNESNKTENQNPNSNEIDLYKVLGLSPGAKDTEVRSAYKKLALEFHPDKNKDPKAGEKFQAIQSAYETITEQQKLGTSV